jgi:alpha-tubulin suppressor-like RCC1 family protein
VSLNIRAVSAGKNQTLALLMSGEVLGWGGAGGGRYSPENVDICSTRSVNREPAYVGQSVFFSTVSAGYGVSLGVSRQKELLVWGWNPIGLDSNQTSSEIPTPIGAIKAPICVAAGQSLFAAIDEKGGLHTWGLNVDQALGRQTEQMNSPPDLVRGLPTVQTVALGDNFMIALAREGSVFSFGSNSAGQLGLGHITNVPKPMPVRISNAMSNIAVGATHVLALCKEGSVYGWGSNQYGQLGHQRTRYSSQPTLIPMPEKMTAIAAGTHFSLALTESGTVYAWGWNGFGQLGLNDARPRSAPTRVPGLVGVQAIAAGEMHALALSQEELLGWGSNESGQLGRAAEKQLRPFPFWRNG